LNWPYRDWKDNVSETVSLTGLSVLTIFFNNATVPMQYSYLVGLTFMVSFLVGVFLVKMVYERRDRFKEFYVYMAEVWRGPVAPDVNPDEDDAEIPTSPSGDLGVADRSRMSTHGFVRRVSRAVASPTAQLSAAVKAKEAAETSAKATADKPGGTVAAEKDKEVEMQITTQPIPADAPGTLASTVPTPMILTPVVVLTPVSPVLTSSVSMGGDPTATSPPPVEIPSPANVRAPLVTTTTTTDSAPPNNTV